MTRTSWQVKKRYNDKHYKRIVADLEAELVDEFKAECEKQNISQAKVIRQAIIDWLKERG